MGNKRYFRWNRMMILMTAGVLCLGGWFFALRLPGRTVILSLERFVLGDDGRYLLASAVCLVILNTFRAVLLYLGWFYLGESVALSRRGKALSWLVPLIAIPCCYIGVSHYRDVFSLHFGAPALFSILTVLIMHVSTREIRGWLARSSVLSLLVFSFQWLDIAPILTHWGFGGGELSHAVKELAIIADWGFVLNALGLGAFATAFTGGIAAAALLIGANRSNVQFRKIRERDQQIAALREETVRTRGYLEIQQLVHDLRRPLTTMLGLADVMAETLPDGATLDHARRIVATGADMNQMIEELLKEDARQRVSVAGLLEYVLSQISAFPWRHIVEARVDDGMGARYVSVNLIRFSRALVNLLDNAHIAVKDRTDPEIELSAAANGDRVLIAVSDNGAGFAEGFYGVSPGLSRWGSTGIGLAFVEEVVKKHGGAMSIANLPSQGASVTIELPLWKEDE